VRALLAPPPLRLALRLPGALCGTEALELQTVPRLLRLQPLLQPGMLCPCHGEPLVAPPASAADGWPLLEQWRCASSGLPPPAGGARVAAGGDGSGLLQLGAHTLLRMPPGAMADAAAAGFAHALGPRVGAVALVAEAVVPRAALDAQLLLGPAVLAVPWSPDEHGEAGGGEGARDEGPQCGAERVAALCAALQARDALLLCACGADLAARRALPLRQWYAAQPGGAGGGALLLWRLAPREALLPLEDSAYAAAAGTEGSGEGAAVGGGGGGADWRAAAEARREAQREAAGALLDGLASGPVARALLGGGGGGNGDAAAAGAGGPLPLLALPAGVGAWADGLLRASSGVYVPAPLPAAGDGGAPAHAHQPRAQTPDPVAGGADAGPAAGGGAPGAARGRAAGAGGRSGGGGGGGGGGAGGPTPPPGGPAASGGGRPPPSGAPRAKGGLSLTLRSSGRRG
jgi:hypothetical protein